MVNVHNKRWFSLLYDKIDLLDIKIKKMDGGRIVDQKKAPLLETLLGYQDLPLYPFHTPGHKQGKGLDGELRRLLAHYDRADVSLMGDELDDPFDPSSCIAEAQELLAELYGAERSYFSAIGTTGALQILMLASFQEGDFIFLPRNAHRSLWSSLVLTGAQPIFLSPRTDCRWGISHNVPLDTWIKAMEKYPGAKGAALVSPTYYGVAGDYSEVVEKAHQNNMTVLIDEAHGPHLQFLKTEIPDGIQSGADGVAQSAHKLLGAFTGASWLHMQGNLIDPIRIKQAFLTMQTSSPNYPLLASLDGARRQVAVEGKEKWTQIEKLAESLREAINQIAGLKCLTPEEVSPCRLDPCKITVQVNGLGITGAEAAQWLRKECMIQPELADYSNVLFLLTYSDREEEVEFLLQSLRRLTEKYQKNKPLPLSYIPVMPEISIPLLSPREVFFRKKKTVLREESLGKIAGEMISFYPPGIPLIWPGEMITEENLTIIEKGQSAGLMISGPADSTLKTIQIVEE